MVTRLSTADASFYGLENTATPMYVGSLSILRRPRAGLSYETLLAAVETAASPDTALPAEGAGIGGRLRQAGMDRRQRLRHHLSRAALGVAVAGQ